MDKFIKLNEDWIEIEYDYMDETDEDITAYFEFKDTKYYLNNFVRCHNNPWGNMDCPDYIHGYDATNYWQPLFVEISNSGDAVNVYKMKREEV